MDFDDIDIKELGLIVLISVGMTLFLSWLGLALDEEIAEKVADEIAKNTCPSCGSVYGNRGE